MILKCLSGLWEIGSVMLRRTIVTIVKEKIVIVILQQAGFSQYTLPLMVVRKVLLERRSTFCSL